MYSFLLQNLLLGCSSEPSLPGPTAEQALEYAQNNPDKIAIHIDVQQNNAYFLSVNVPASETHTSGLMHLHEKGYENIDCSEYKTEEDKPGTQVCFFTSKGKCGLLNTVTGVELTPAQYDCTNPKVSFVNNDLHVEFEDMSNQMLKVKDNVVTTVSKQIVEKPPEPTVSTAGPECTEALAAPKSQEDVLNAFKTNSWGGLKELTEDLAKQVACSEKTEDKATIYAKIDEMLQPELSKLRLKTKVSGLRGVPPQGSLKKCHLGFDEEKGPLILCASSLRISNLEKSAGTDIKVICEKTYKGPSSSIFFTGTRPDNMMSVAACFASGSTSVTIRANKPIKSKSIKKITPKK